jgi:hypothetical protein
MKRDIYKKLMNLQSSEADALLANKFDELDTAIRAAKDNDVIYKQLEALEQFVYKVSDKAVGLTTYLLEMKPLPPKVYQTQFGPYEGKEYKDIVNKVLELLNRIRFYQTREIIAIYFDLYVAGAKKELEDKIRDISQYDLQALNHIGYSAQLHIIDFLHKHKQKNEAYFDFFMEVAQHLVNTEGESHTMKDENTLEFGFAPLPYNKDIEHVRDWLLDEIERLLMKPGIDLESKMKLIELSASLAQEPHRGKPSDDLNALIQKNTARVVALYEKVIGDMISTTPSLPLAIEVEERLIFIERDVKNKEILQSIDNLIASLNNNYAYSVYRTLVGAKLDYFSRKNETYEEARDANEKERADLLDNIADEDSPVISVLEDVATYWGKVDAWKLNSYESFLASFAKQKPDIALRVLEQASKKNAPLVKFAGNFVLGFRNANATHEYSKAIDLIVADKNREAIRLTCLAMTIGEPTESDIAMAIEIFHHKGRFSYLQKQDGPSYLHFLIQIFIKLLPRKDARYDQQFIELLSNDEDLSNFDTATIQHEADLENISDNVRQYLIDKLLTVRDLSYQHQELLLSMYGKDAKQLVDFFVQRIKVKEKNPKLKRREYDPVPYHLNDTLISAIKENGAYADIFKASLSSFTPNWSVYNSELGDLFERVGGYKTALMEFLNKAKKEDLKRALSLFDGIESIDLDVAVAIVKQTDDKKLWRSVRSHLYATGMVSGEYGLANEHQRKHDYLKEHYSKSGNKRIREFVEDTLKWLEAQVKAERQKTEEDLRLRKVDFEH